MPHKDPEARRAYHSEYRKSHPRKRTLKDNETARAWHSRHPAYNANQMLKKKYGITSEQRDQMLVAQGGVCAVCGGDNSESKRNWHVDHCHTSGKVRGILCHLCNVGLGHFRDKPELLKTAAAYLEKA